MNDKPEGEPIPKEPPLSFPEETDLMINLVKDEEARQALLDHQQSVLEYHEWLDRNPDATDDEVQKAKTDRTAATLERVEGLVEKPGVKEGLLGIFIGEMGLKR